MRIKKNLHPWLSPYVVCGLSAKRKRRDVVCERGIVCGGMSGVALHWLLHILLLSVERRK